MNILTASEHRDMRELCIVPGGKRKIWDDDPSTGPTSARDVYIGPLTKKSIAYAEHFYPHDWRILSAEYGFLHPDDIIPGPSEACFLHQESQQIGIDELIRQIGSEGLDKYDTIVVLGGRFFSDLVEKTFRGKRIVSPLASSRGIGFMMHRLSDAIEKDQAL